MLHARLAASTLLTTTLSFAGATLATGTVPTPTVEGPLSGGLGAPFIAATTFDLAEVGYTQDEYFVSGTATAYTNVGPLRSDGMWTVTPGETAAYKTRILVYRPIRRPRWSRPGTGSVVISISAASIDLPWSVGPIRVV